MKRRTVLKRAGASSGTIAVAGCLNEGGGGGDGDGDGDGDGGDGTTTEETTEETTTGSLSLGEKALENVDTGCGEENSATITFEESGASVQGKIPASDPCHKATFVDVSLAEDALTVVLAAEETDADACEQCLGEVEYLARIETKNGLPASVTVEHEAMGETTVVAETTR